MKMIGLVKHIFICSLITVSHFADGAVITRNDFSLDTSSNIVTGNGLNWTRWDTVVGVSFNQALAQYATQGWRLASSDEMMGMYTQFIPTVDWANAQGENNSVSSAISVSEYDDLTTIFGVSFNEFGGISNIIFGNDLDNDGAYRSAGAYYTDWEPAAGLYSDNSRYTEDFSSSDFSVQLVRATNVNAPNTSYLLVLMLLFLGLFKHQFNQL